MRRTFLLAFVTTALATILFSPPGAMAAEEVKRIAVFPFVVNATTPEGAAALKEDVYTGITAELQKVRRIRLVEREAVTAAIAGKLLNDALALAVGRETRADYAVTGSVTAFGERISVDVRLIDVRDGKTLPGIFVQGRGIQNLGAIITQLGMDMVARIASEQRIARVEFHGNRKIEASAINQVLKSSMGNIFSDADLSADIKAIYQMGYFDDVTADVTDAPEGKVVTFTVVEKPLITEIQIKGNKILKRDDIEAAMIVRSRQTVSTEKLRADTEKIKALYDAKGFYNAQIRYDIEKLGERDAAVVITIVENEKSYIRSIQFEGNRTFTAKELKSMMSTNEWGIFHFITDSGVLKKDQLEQDIGKINAFYLNNGFINAHVGEPEIIHEPDGITIKIPISEGKQFRVGKVTIAGDELATPRETLLASLQIRKKEFFDREAIMKDMDYLTQVSNDEGYANAEITPRTVPQEETQTVDVSYEISKRRLVYLNWINITGNAKTRDKVIRRELSITEGDLYNRTKLKNSYMALNRLRYFEQVEFQAEKGPDETLTDINIHVKEKPTGMFSIGAGYSAMDGPILSAQISQQNLFGRGQVLSVKANIGGKSTLYDISFVEPWLFDMPLWSKFDVWNFYREYDTYNYKSKGVGATLGYPFWRYVTGYLGYRLAINDVYDVQDLASGIVKDQVGETTTSGVTVSLTRDSTDDYMFPSTGSKNTSSVEYTGGPLGGDVSYTRFGVTSAWFFALPLDTVFGARGKIGAIRANEGEIPVYERYILGGINSLRGLSNVGPKDPITGEVIGGTTMLSFNFEYVFPLIKNAGMKGVTFFDTGNTWESGFHVNDMRKTAGVGIRWYSPIGPLRLEWGYVLDRKENEDSSKWEFTMGMFM
jgi:outer membrane protein insertion porin family